MQNGMLKVTERMRDYVKYLNLCVRMHTVRFVHKLKSNSGNCGSLLLLPTIGMVCKLRQMREFQQVLMMRRVDGG